VASRAFRAGAPEHGRPQISGPAKEGETLTASNGTWSKTRRLRTPTSAPCAADGTACWDITGATKQTDVVLAADIGHTLRVSSPHRMRTASLRDLRWDRRRRSNLVRHSVKPAVAAPPPSAGAQVSTRLPGPRSRSIGYQWQRCTSTGTDCLNVAVRPRWSTASARLTSTTDARVGPLCHSTGRRRRVDPVERRAKQHDTTTNVTTTTVQATRPRQSPSSRSQRVGVRVFAPLPRCGR